MGFDKIEAVSLTDQFVHKVESMIISGELMPGDQLPPARELSARMGVSRPVISAGLIELEKMGFVDIVARQGVYVSDYRKTGSLDTLTALLNYNGGVMRDDEVRSLMEVRSANECLCVKLVVERATQDELDGLAPMLDAIKDAKTDQEGAEATFQFHHALSVLSRNTFLPLLYNSIHSYGLHFWSLYRQRYGANRLYQNKLELYRALLDRDATTASEVPAGEVRATSYLGDAETFSRVPFDKRSLVDESLETAARNAANTLFAIRRHRMELITSEAGEHVFGAGLQAALAELDRQEQAYTELFLGKRVTTTSVERITVVPDAGKQKYILCRFSPDRGLLPGNDLTGDVVLLQLDKESDGSFTLTPASPKAVRTATYRVAADVVCTVYCGTEELTRATLPLFEFGRDVELALPSKK
jgi:DNA-binding FadR family transcriptional regulator